MPSVIEQPVETKSVAVSARDLSREQYRTLLAVITLAAAFIRFWHLGTRGFMIDEGFSWAIARSPWSDFFYGLATRTADMTLHYFLLHLWSGLGQSEFALRSVSALFGIATVPVIAEIGKRLYSRQAGLIAAAVFAVHIFAIKFSQEIRAYPMVMFFAALGWLQLTRIVREPSRRNWFWFSLISLAMIYSHFIAGLNLVAQVATLAFLPISRIGWRKLLESLATIFVGLMPAIIYTLIHKGDLSWIKRTDIAILREFFDSVAGRSGNSIQIYVVWTLFAIVIGASLLALKREPTGYSAWGVAIPVVGTILPFLMLVAVAAIQPIFVPRYVAYVVVPFVLGLGWFFSRMKPMVRAVGTVALITLFAWPLPAYYKETSWQDFRGAVEYVALRHQPGDALVVWEPMARPAVEYYGSRVAGFPEFIFPKSGDHFHAEDMLMLPDPYHLPGVFPKYKRIWIIFDLDKSPEEYKIVPPLFFEHVISRTHTQVAFKQFKNVRVEEFVLRETAN